MSSVVPLVGAIARNRPLARVVLAYAVFTATQNAVWIGMLVYAFARGGAGTAGAVAVLQLVPAALVAPVAAGLADRRSPSGVLTGGYLVQVLGMLATAAAIALDAAPAAYAAAVLASVAVATTRPAQAVVVPALVRSAEELTATNAVAGWVESAGAVASSLATGVLLAVAGPGWVFAAAGPAGIVSVGLAATVRGVRPPVGLGRSVRRVQLRAGEVLIREGDEADGFYAVVDGGLDVTVRGAPAGRMVRGDGVGEIALLRSVPRTATVTAAVPSSVLALDRDAFLAAVAGHAATGDTASDVARERLEADRRRTPGSDGEPGTAPA